MAVLFYMVSSSISKIFFCCMIKENGSFFGLHICLGFTLFGIGFVQARTYSEAFIFGGRLRFFFSVVGNITPPSHLFLLLHQQIMVEIPPEVFFFFALVRLCRPAVRRNCLFIVRHRHHLRMQSRRKVASLLLLRHILRRQKVLKPARVRLIN